jgi:mannose-1-phosphate guanylyltransferase/mannose-6-phosphate isomerase
LRRSSRRAHPFGAQAAVLIIAGGRGTRLWPETRVTRPKPLLRLSGRRSLIEETIARHQPLVPRERIFVLVPRSQAIFFRRALRGVLARGNLLIEPEERGTTVAIAYGCALIRRRLGEVMLAVMPADHYVAPPAAFRRTLRAALKLASRHRTIALIGVRPARPDPGYGYFQIGAPLDGGYRVVRFVEKPSILIARRMIRSGRFLWNAGMFVMSSQTLAARLGEHCPALAAAMDQFSASAPGARRLYARLHFDSFDRAVIEKSAGTLAVRAGFQWHDVGSWEGLWEAMRGDQRNVLAGRVLALDSDGIFARADNRLIVILGVEDLIAIDTADALLIARRSRSQDVRRVTEELTRGGLHRYL